MKKRRRDADSALVPDEVIVPPPPPPLRTRHPDDESEAALELDERVSLRSLDGCLTVLEATGQALCERRICDKAAKAFVSITSAAATIIEAKERMKRAAGAARPNVEEDPAAALTEAERAQGPFALGVLEGGKR